MIKLTFSIIDYIVDFANNAVRPLSAIQLSASNLSETAACLVPAIRIVGISYRGGREGFIAYDSPEHLRMETTNSPSSQKRT